MGERSAAERILGTEEQCNNFTTFGGALVIIINCEIIITNYVLKIIKLKLVTLFYNYVPFGSRRIRIIMILFEVHWRSRQ